MQLNIGLLCKQYFLQDVYCQVENRAIDFQ